MDDDDDALAPKSPGLVPRDLEAMSIAALGEYIAELEAEIARAKAMIDKKERARSAAAGVFRS